MDPSLKYFGFNFEKSLKDFSALNNNVIMAYIGHDNTGRLVKQGYALFINRYIQDVWTAKNGEIAIAKASCYPKMRKNDMPYQLYFEMTSSNGSASVFSSYCSCKAGLGKCIHIVALLYMMNHWILSNFEEIPEEETCTSLEQQWHKPRGKAIEAEPIMQMTFAKPRKNRLRQPLQCSFNADYLKYKPTSAEVLCFKKEINKADSSCPISHLLCSDAGENVKTAVGDIPSKSLIYHHVQNFNKSPNISTDVALTNKVYPDLPVELLTRQADFEVISSLEISLPQAIDVERETRGQDNALWHSARRLRLTASMFSKICLRRKKVDEKFLNSLYESQDLSKVRSIAYGRRKEPEARKAYIKAKNVNSNFVILFTSGLVINPGIPFLGCSPDGKVLDDKEEPKFGLLEIKCPLSKQNNTLEEVCADKRFYCELVNGKMSLKKNSLAYYQVQGQMLVTGIQWCDFVVFNGSDVWIERIRKDTAFCQDMMNKLCTFYNSYWQPFIESRVGNS